MRINLRTAGDNGPASGKNILERDRHPVQRAPIGTAGDLSLGLACSLARLLSPKRDKSVIVAIQPLSALQGGFGGLDRRDLSCADQFPELSNGQPA
jgi:hypothetical protein